MEIDMTYKFKVMQQNLEQEEAEHKATKARLADKNKIYESIEEAKSEAMKGMYLTSQLDLGVNYTKHIISSFPVHILVHLMTSEISWREG